MSNINTAIWPWFMPLLFVLAGISSFYALGEKTIKKFMLERIRKLFVPLFFGILLICPFLTYFAERYHNGYTGTYFHQYILFFTKTTDLTGFKGGFTPGHLWFILYLFIISLISIPVVLINKIRKINIMVDKINLVCIILLFIFPLLGHFIFNIADKSIGEYFFYYIIGHFILSNDKIIGKCSKHGYLLGALVTISAILYMVNFNLFQNEIMAFIPFILGKFYAFCSILFILGIGKKHFDFSNKIVYYFSANSFGVYLFHLPWIIVIAYYLINTIQNIYTQAISIMMLSIFFTIASIEILKRIFITRFIFCLKNDGK